MTPEQIKKEADRLAALFMDKEARRKTDDVELAFYESAAEIQRGVKRALLCVDEMIDVVDARNPYQLKVWHSVKQDLQSRL